MSKNETYYGYSSVDSKNVELMISQCDSLCKNESSEVFFKMMSNRIIPIFHSEKELPYSPDDFASSIISCLDKYSFKEIIDHIEPVELIVSEIPAFNSLSMIDIILRRLVEDRSATYYELGSYICKDYANKEAKLKAGEVHSKLMSSLALSELVLSSTPRITTITPLGERFIRMDLKKRSKLMMKLLLKIPIIAYALKRAEYGPILIKDIMKEVGLKESSLQRRGSSIRALFDMLGKTDDDYLNKLCMNVLA